MAEPEPGALSPEGQARLREATGRYPWEPVSVADVAVILAACRIWVAELERALAERGYRGPL